MKKFIYNNFPYLVIAGFVLVIAVLNYTPGTFLTGGDNLHPEFDLGMNIKRSVFSVWQEYQGLGLLGGMGHAADLLRQLVLLPFSWFLPENSLRFIYTFITLFVGSAGAFKLTKKIIPSYLQEYNPLKLNLLSLVGGLFYLLNLSTVQSYFTPFEVFTAHFAFLPWMILATMNYFTKPNRKSALLLALTLFIATPASYVPTLFVIYLISASITALFYFQKRRDYFKTILKFLIIVFVINSFWLLPFSFFTLTSSGVNVNAKINQMATDAIFLQNKEFGDLGNVALLKGFWFNNIEPNLDGNYVYMLSSWKNYFSNLFVNLIGYSLFAGVLLGAIYSIRKRKREGMIFSAILLFSIIMLANATPPFSFINDFLRNYVPLFGQIFRFPFTKFSILASLSFAILLPLGLLAITNWLKRIKPNIDYLVFALTVAAMIAFVFPIFKGNLFYQKEKTKIPQEYFQTFNYFKTQDPNTRIADFPQYSFWGWDFYNWNYSGSGFIWYGINQPILDRAFDVWSNQNENYYWELNRALYAKDENQFAEILNKYDINYLLIDKNITAPSSPQSLFNNELKAMITKLPQIRKAQQFGNIEIYKVSLGNKPKSFVSTLSTLSSANSSLWSNYDQEYALNGDYFTSMDASQNLNFFPFKSLFTNKAQNEISFSSRVTKDSIEFISPLPEYKNPAQLHIPSLVSQNNTLPVNIVVSKTNGLINIDFELRTPEIYLKSGNQTKKLWQSSIKRNLFKGQTDDILWLNVNGVSSFEISNIPEGGKKTIATTTLTLDQPNVLVLNNLDGEIDRANIEGSMLREWFPQNDSFISLASVPKDSTLIVKVARLNDNYLSSVIDPAQKVRSGQNKIQNCDNFRKEYFSYFIKKDQEQKLLELASTNATSCISFYLPNLDHDQGYFMTVQNKNLKGQGLHFWVLNEDEKTPLVDTYLAKSKTDTTSVMVLPPMERFGKAYSLHFENISIGKADSGNLLGQITLDPIPYFFITNLELQNPSKHVQGFENNQIQVSHPNQSLYTVKLVNDSPAALSLSQSYSPYWKAYEVNNLGIVNKIFPFFGKEIKIHVMVDNWKNGWITEGHTGNQIIIVYLPQYLQYFGFILTGSSLIALMLAWLKHRNPRVKDLT